MFNQIVNTNEMVNCLVFVESYTIYSNGKIEHIVKNDKNFKHLTQNLKELFFDARIMPAFGVSLHNDTINAIKTDTWLEINFLSEQKINDLPFTSLLFKVEETYGINLIRKYNNKYEGRCIFFDLINQFDLQVIINFKQKHKTNYITSLTRNH